jgi:hypothetical protein
MLMWSMASAAVAGSLMSLSLSVSLPGAAALDSSFVKAYTGFNKNSQIMSLAPSGLQNGDEFGIKVDMW